MKQTKTPIEVLCEELESAIQATIDLTDGELTIGDIVGALEVTKLAWFREQYGGCNEEKEVWQ